VVKKKAAAEPAYADSLTDIIASLSRLRGVVESSGLPEGEAKQTLITQLALASIAAHRFRLASDDDIIVIDE